MLWIRPWLKKNIIVVLLTAQHIKLQKFLLYQLIFSWKLMDKPAYRGRGQSFSTAERCWNKCWRALQGRGEDNCNRRLRPWPFGEWHCYMASDFKENPSRLERSLSRICSRGLGRRAFLSAVNVSIKNLHMAHSFGNADFHDRALCRFSPSSLATHDCALFLSPASPPLLPPLTLISYFGVVCGGSFPDSTWARIYG